MQKFKLKKDGEVVGYEKRIVVNNDMHIEQSINGSAWCPIIGSPPPYGKSSAIWINHDTVEPFVCLDKNGDEVYEGDKVRRVRFDGDPRPRKEYEGKIVWHHGFLQWSLKVGRVGDENVYDLEDLVDSEIFEAGIELLKAEKGEKE